MQMRNVKGERRKRERQKRKSRKENNARGGGGSDDGGGGGGGDDDSVLGLQEPYYEKTMRDVATTYGAAVLQQAKEMNALDLRLYHWARERETRR